MRTQTSSVVSLLLFLAACGDVDPALSQASSQTRLDAKPSSSADAKPEEPKPSSADALPADTKPDDTKPTTTADTKPEDPSSVTAVPSCTFDYQCGKDEVCEGCGEKDKRCVPGCRTSCLVGRCVEVQCVTCPCPAQCI